MLCDIGNCAMMPVHRSLLNETNVNTPRFSDPYGTIIFVADIPICFQIANQKQEERCKL
jgi:hypothetical protein